VKFFLSRKAHRAFGAGLRFLSFQSDTSLHCKTTDTGLVITRCACLRSGFCCYSLCLPMEGWPGWVDLGGWLHTGIVTHPSTNRDRRRLTSLMWPTKLST